MRRRTFVRPEAQTDIKEAARWYENREAGLSTRYIDQIRNMLQQIAENPLSFPVALGIYGVSYFRKLPIPSTSLSNLIALPLSQCLINTYGPTHGKFVDEMMAN